LFYQESFIVLFRRLPFASPAQALDWGVWRVVHLLEMDATVENHPSSL